MCYNLGENSILAQEARIFWRECAEARATCNGGIGW